MVVNPFSELSERLQNIEGMLQQMQQQPAPGLAAHPNEVLFDVKEAAEFLRLTVPTVYTMVSRRQLPVMKRAKRLMFSREELLEYLKKGRRKTMEELEAEASKPVRNRIKKGSHE